MLAKREEGKSGMLMGKTGGSSMELKLERNEISAIAIVFLLSFCFWFFPAKNTLPEFGSATQIRGALDGVAAPAHIAIAASAAKIAGASSSAPQSIVSFLLVFPPLLLALASLFAYLALRQLNFRRAPSAFAALLFPLSLSALAFLPGVYGSLQLAAPLFALFLFFFASFIAKKEQLMLVPALLFAAASAYINAVFGIAGVVAVLSFAAEAYLKKDRRLLQFAVLLIVFAAALFISPEKQQTFFSLSSLGSVLALSPFLFAAGSVAAVLFLFSAGATEYFLLFISGIFVSIFSPAAGALLLVLPCAQGISAAMEQNLAKAAKLASAFAIAFFAFMGLSVSAGSSIPKAAAISAMLAVLAPLSLHFYEYRSHRLLPAFCLALLALSAFTAIFYQLPPQRDYFPPYADKDLASALSSLSSKGAASISILGSQDAARFYLPSVEFVPNQDVLSYLVSGKPLPHSGSYAVLSTGYLDAAQLGDTFDSFSYSNNFSSGAAYYALFYSTSGRLLAREIAADGSLALKDGVLLDGSGRAYGDLPLSRMLLIRQAKPFSDRNNRLVVLGEGEGLPYFMKIYSGAASELGQPDESGKVSVYKVK